MLYSLINMGLKKTSTYLYCFSPPVMLATFAIEVIFALYIIWRYKATATSRLIVSILAFLAIFQVSEYMICGGLGIQPGIWSRLGYAAITMLPPLGLHLMHKLAGRRTSALVGMAYVSAAAFVAYFVFATQAISGATCYANYAVFDTAKGSSLLYGLYYYGWMFTAIILGTHWSASVKRQMKPALFALIFGYLAFIMPTTFVNIVDPSTVAGIPSIMCGFAVILAFVLVAKVSPEALRPKSKNTVMSLRLRWPS